MIDARSFLPSPDPCARLPGRFGAWEEAVRELPRLLGAGGGAATRRIASLPELDASELNGALELERAMMLLSFLGQAVIWDDFAAAPARSVPRAVAVPWAEVARRVGRPPVLSYASHALHNWARIDPSGPVALGNLVTFANFLGGMDEDWFILSHVALESHVTPMLAAAAALEAAVAQDDEGEAVSQLQAFAAAQEQMYQTMLRLPERCDPHIFFTRIQPFLRGFHEHPVVYEGVREWEGKPQAFVGASAAQSAMLAVQDAALGVVHPDDHLKGYLIELRRYMPPAHRALLERLEQVPSVRSWIVDRRGAPGVLADAYDACIDQLVRLRTKHVELTAVFILGQKKGPTSGEEQGTGGTPFMRYLKKHRDDTVRHRIR